VSLPGIVALFALIVLVPMFVALAVASMESEITAGGKWDHRRIDGEIHCGSGAKKKFGRAVLTIAVSQRWR